MNYQPKPCIDCGDPLPPPPCEENEPRCDGYYPSDCMRYDGVTTQCGSVRIEHGEMFSTILPKILAAICFPYEGVRLESTPSVKVVGNGSVVSPYKMQVVLDPSIENLLKAGPNGLSFTITDSVITKVLEGIADNEGLQVLFTNLVAEACPNCAPNNNCVEGNLVSESTEVEYCTDQLTVFRDRKRQVRLHGDCTTYIDYTDWVIRNTCVPVSCAIPQINSLIM